MDKKLRLTAFGKCNLSLNITGKSGNMHDLDSVMMSVDVFDTVTVAERRDDVISVRFTGADIDPVNNTAYAAAREVAKLVGHGFDIEVEKGIPMGAGLGGSSADGAAVLRALDIFYRLPSLGIDMRALALSVGSDVPFMLTGGLARVRGTGDDLFFIQNKLKLFAVGLMTESVYTARAYAKFDELYPSAAFCPTDNDLLCDKLLSADKTAIDCFGNALTAPAAALAPSITKNASLLSDCGARPVMTGSGGMVLGFFDSIDEFFVCAQKLRTAPGFRVVSGVDTGIL